MRTKLIWKSCSYIFKLKSWASADLFPREDKHFPGGQEPIFCLKNNKKDTISQKSLIHTVFGRPTGGQEPPLPPPLRTPMVKMYIWWISTCFCHSVDTVMKPDDQYVSWNAAEVPRRVFRNTSTNEFSVEQEVLALIAPLVKLGCHQAQADFIRLMCVRVLYDFTQSIHPSGTMRANNSWLATFLLAAILYLSFYGKLAIRYFWNMIITTPSM